MRNGAQIVTTYDNKKVELVFNERILSPIENEGILDINFGPEILSWKMRLIFDSKEGDQAFTTKWEFNVDGFHIRATFFNWSSPAGEIELQRPYMIATADGKDSFYFKVASKRISNVDKGRTIQVSVWKAI
jgi:hypothetical protein